NSDRAESKNFQRSAAEEHSAECAASMRTHNDEIASGLLRGHDDSLRGVLVIDMVGLTRCSRLVGGPFDAIEDGGRVSCSGLLINLDHGWSWQSRVRSLGPRFRDGYDRDLGCQRFGQRKPMH